MKQKHTITNLLLFIGLSVLSFVIPKLATSSKDAMLLSSILFIYFIAFSFGTYKISESISTNQSRFNAVFFGVTGLRMILIIFLFLIYLLISDITNKIGIVFLICSYFIFMGFEIKIILHKLRPDLGNQKANENARK
jgi:hypothetical protein